MYAVMYIFRATLCKEVVERLAAVNDWSFERASDDEITILVNGQWSDYQVSFTWMLLSSHSRRATSTMLAGT